MNLLNSPRRQATVHSLELVSSKSRLERKNYRHYRLVHSPLPLGVRCGTLAAYFGVSRDTLRRWETGEREPSGAARRLIWLLNTLLANPERLNDGLDMLMWGKKREAQEFNKLLKTLPNGDQPASRPPGPKDLSGPGRGVPSRV